MTETVIRPSLHQPHSFLKQVAALVRRLGLVRQAVRQRMVADIARKRIAPVLGAPVAERGPKPVHGESPLPIRLKTAVRLISESGVFESLPGKTNALERVVDARRDITASDSGTRCCLPAFMRVAGMAFSSHANLSKRRTPWKTDHQLTFSTTDAREIRKRKYGLYD